MDEIISGYLDPRFRYVWARGPAVVRSREDALRDGLNCVALAHLVIRELFGHALPAGFQSLELFGDDEHFESIADGALLAAGDLIWFGAANPRIPPADFVPRFRDGELLNFADFAVNHVAVATGRRVDGHSLLLHASPVNGTNALWPLHRFAEHERYREIYGIRRLRRELRADARPPTRWTPAGRSTNGRTWSSARRTTPTSARSTSPPTRSATTCSQPGSDTQEAAPIAPD